MVYLGFNEDLFDSGVALCDGQRVLYAANEERFTRRKNEGGFPRRSLQGLLDATGVRPADIAGICIAGHMTPPFPVRLFPRLHDWIFDAKRAQSGHWMQRLADWAVFMTPVSHSRESSIMRRAVKPLLAPVERRTLPKSLRHAPLHFIEHHLAHAAGAWWSSGFERALCITADGMGDGLSLTVSRCALGQGIQRLWSVASRDSFGLFFEALTAAFGFVPCRDEGKITGLAAAGHADRIPCASPFSFVNGALLYSGPLGRRAVERLKKALAAGCTREDLSAWAQQILENNILEAARWWLRETGLRQLTVAGGVFANVKLNQRLHELPEVDNLFVYPNMGDGGLGLGALCAHAAFRPEPLGDVFWGDSYDDAAVERALKREPGLDYRRVEDIELEVANALAQGHIVARFHGKMEWGPRALGNRSILVRTENRQVVERLNTRLARSDFMPFAPAILDEDADLFLMDAAAARRAAEFMTVCFACTPRMKDEHPAVVHLDGTARAQVVRKETNPTLHRILAAFKQRTGSSVVLNTSFNIHEEPIVRTPEEAIAAFRRARLDYLAIGKWLVTSG